MIYKSYTFQYEAERKLGIFVQIFDFIYLLQLNEESPVAKLERLCQANKLPSPDYVIEREDDGFCATVDFGEDIAISETPAQTEELAKEAAAQIALEYFEDQGLENSGQCSVWYGHVFIMPSIVIKEGQTIFQHFDSIVWQSSRVKIFL